MPLDAQVDLLREHHHEAGAETHEHIRAQPRRLMARLPLIADDAAEHAGEHQAQQELALADLRHPSASSHISCPYYTTTNVSRHLSAQEKIKELTDKGICVNILNMGEVDERPQGRLMLHILLAFAEFERDMIVERTQAGKAVARNKAGFKEGRPPIDKARKNAAVDMVLNGGKSYKEAAEKAL